MYFHGSSKELEIGKIIYPRNNYEKDWGHTDFYKALEFYRPRHFIGHNSGVFMCDNEDDVDLCGGSIDFIYEVEPIGKIQKHDLNWGSEVSCLMSDNYNIHSNEVKNAALNYWNGLPHIDENVWEYLTEKFIVKELVHTEELTIRPL